MIHFTKGHVHWVILGRRMNSAPCEAFTSIFHMQDTRDPGVIPGSEGMDVNGRVDVNGLQVLDYVTLPRITQWTRMDVKEGPKSARPRPPGSLDPVAMDAAFDFSEVGRRRI
jgi:hypothetical protein